MFGVKNPVASKHKSRMRIASKLIGLRNTRFLELFRHKVTLVPNTPAGWVWAGAAMSPAILHLFRSSLSTCRYYSAFNFESMHRMRVQIVRI